MSYRALGQLATCYLLTVGATGALDEACTVEAGDDHRRVSEGHVLLQMDRSRPNRIESHQANSVGHDRFADWKTCVGTNDIGSTAALDESGYLAVAKTCCNREMYDFMRRTISSLSMEICDEGGLMGLVPWFTCETAGVMKSRPDQDYTGSYAELEEALQKHRMPAKCFFVAATGSCEPWPATDAAECGSRGVWDPDYWKHHPCPTTVASTTAAPITAAPTTAAPTTAAPTTATPTPTTAAPEPTTTAATTPEPTTTAARTPAPTTTTAAPAPTAMFQYLASTSLFQYLANLFGSAFYF